MELVMSTNDNSYFNWKECHPWMFKTINTVKIDNYLHEFQSAYCLKCKSFNCPKTPLYTYQSVYTKSPKE